MDSLFVLIQIVNVPLCGWELGGYQTLPPSISTFSSFSSSRRRTLPHSRRRGNPSSSVSNTLSSRGELLLRPVATFPPPSSPETAPRRGEGRVQLRSGCSDSPFYSSATMSTMSTTMSTTMPMSTAALVDLSTSSSNILPTDAILATSCPRAPKYGSGRMNNFAYENRFAELVMPVDLIPTILKGSFGSTPWWGWWPTTSVFKSRWKITTTSRVMFSQPTWEPFPKDQQPKVCLRR